MFCHSVNFTVSRRNVKRTFVLVTGVCWAMSDLQSVSHAAEFYPITSATASTADNDLWPAENLIQGPGPGFDASEPHLQMVDSGEEDLWVTAACGFPCDYIETTGNPVLTFDLGEDRSLKEISVWGYSAGNANGINDFSLRFATDADGPDGFGTSVTFNPRITEIPFGAEERESRLFYREVTARYVELTAEDNYFVAPGDGSGGEVPGGDRVGLGELAFAMIEEEFVTGDFNQDGVLDIADYEVMLANFRGGATFQEGDLNLDRQVNLFDFLEFQSIFSAAPAAAVPEPSTWILGAIAFLALAWNRRRFSRDR